MKYAAPRSWTTLPTYSRSSVSRTAAATSTGAPGPVDRHRPDATGTRRRHRASRATGRRTTTPTALDLHHLDHLEPLEPPGRRAQRWLHLPGDEVVGHRVADDAAARTAPASRAVTYMCQRPSSACTTHGSRQCLLGPAGELELVPPRVGGHDQVGPGPAGRGPRRLPRRSVAPAPRPRSREPGREQPPARPGLARCIRSTGRGRRRRPASGNGSAQPLPTDEVVGHGVADPCVAVPEVGVAQRARCMQEEQVVRGGCVRRTWPEVPDEVVVEVEAHTEAPGWSTGFSLRDAGLAPAGIHQDLDGAASHLGERAGRGW